MAAMANITVKNSANADVVYNAVSPSPGDRVGAIWRQTLAHAVMSFRPTFKLAMRTNAAGNGRVVEGTFKFPVIQSISGVDTLVATVPMSFSGTLPTNIATVHNIDAFTQFGNLLVSALVRLSIDEQNPPT